MKSPIQAPQRMVSNKDNNVKLMYYDYQGFEEWIPPGLQFDEKCLRINEFDNHLLIKKRRNRIEIQKSSLSGIKRYMSVPIRRHSFNMLLLLCFHLTLQLVTVYS